MQEAGQFFPARYFTVRTRPGWWLLAIGLSVLSPVQASEESPMDFFSASPAVRKSSTASQRGAVERPSYPLDLNLDALASGSITVGTRLRCEPEPGVFFTARVSRIDVDVNGTLSLLAPLEDREYAFLSVSASGSQALGEIRLPDEQRRYLIQFDAPQNGHVSEDWADPEMDELMPGPAITPPLPDTIHPAADSRRTPSTEEEPVFLDAGNTVIDLMIVYTPAALTYAGGTAGINNVIAQAMTRAQACMDNSQIPVTFRLAHSAQITYTESGNSNTDIARLQNTSDGYMDEVHAWRDTYGADVVHLLTTANDTGGLGYLLNTTAGLPAWAFSLTRVQQAATTYTVIHEVGHNMGAHHHKAQNVQPGPGLYSYAAGWRWTGTNGSRYCSVMTYEAGTYFADGLSHTRVGWFSSPSTTYQGAATGDAADGDNARCLSNVRTVVAAYRTAASTNFWCRAVALNDRVLLRWEDPLDCGFSNPTVLIRYGLTNYPAATNQGTFVYQGTNQSFLHTNVVSGQPHYYTIWATHDGTTFIEP